MVNFVSQSNTGKTNNLFHYSCKFGTQTKKEEKMLTRIRVHFGNKMGGAGKGGIHFYKNWVNKKANHLSPETWMKPAKPAPKTRFFSHPQVYSNRMYHYQNASRKGLKLKWVILSIVHCGCQSQNNIGFNCCVLITCDQVFFFFFGRGRKSAGQTDMYRDMAMAWSQASTCTLKEFFPW